MRRSGKHDATPCNAAWVCAMTSLLVFLVAALLGAAVYFEYEAVDVHRYFHVYRQWLYSLPPHKCALADHPRRYGVTVTALRPKDCPKYTRSRAAHQRPRPRIFTAIMTSQLRTAHQTAILDTWARRTPVAWYSDSFDSALNNTVVTNPKGDTFDETFFKSLEVCFSCDLI
jgi:hypothetical protein